MAPYILVVDDEESVRFTFQYFLAEQGYRTSTEKSYASALASLERQTPDVLICDIFLGDRRGTDLVGVLKEMGAICPVIVLTGKPSLATAAEAVRIGAFDYLTKPVEKQALLKVVKQALRHKALEEEKEQYRHRITAIFQSVKEGIITVDRRLRVLDANPQVASICGVEPARIVGLAFGRALDQCRGSCVKLLEQAMAQDRNLEEVTVECGRSSRPDQLVVLNSSPLAGQQGHQRELVLTIRDVTRLHRLEKRLDTRRPFHRLVGQSPQMQRIYRFIDDLAPTSTTVLVTGESGTGKELVVEALHYRSPRAPKPLVKVNCGAIAESLLESELFGHVKGAFTGAERNKSGRFLAAAGGTIFLDEIGEISPRLQMGLLRVIQDKRFEPVGSSSPLEVDVRIVAATNADLEDRVRQGLFRQDLYYRLKVFDIHLPPLRERKDDIPLLVQHFIQKNRQSFDKDVLGISDNVMELFLRFPWPGNVRQLEHAIEHAFVVCRGTTILVDHLPADIVQYRPDPDSVPREREALDREAVLAALTACDWNKAKAARRLGVSRTTLYRKIAEYGIKSSPGEM